MDRDTFYKSSIPVQAREKVTGKYADKTPRWAEYYLGKELVGIRSFHPGGELESESAWRDGIRHGWAYRWDDPGVLLSAEPYENGVPHGTAYQWACDGRLIGSYTLEHGTGIDLWWQEWMDGSACLSEASWMQAGLLHGIRWWFNGRGKLSHEEQMHRGLSHGIERMWNSEGKLRRGYPRYWVQGERVTKAQYLHAAAKDDSLPPFRAEDNLPYRDYPSEIALHLQGSQQS
jgi:antitoxin component YwqK of YwqJK toxin-antitoxin module